MTTHALPSPVQGVIESLHAKYRQLKDGEVADYIPELGHASPDWFGICLASRDGQVYEVGDTEQEFTIQSISKAFTYGIGLEDNGLGGVLSHISVEPTGDLFNSISLKPQDGRPFNPMINAGAIASTGLVRGATTAEKVARIRDVFGKYAGRELDVATTVYESESETGHRNRAIGWMLRNFEHIDGDPGPTLEAYFQQCSLSVNCKDLALMGATLANGGVNPVTGVRAIAAEHVVRVLSVMGTCGMYDYAGEWLFHVGLPAKSGVGGGILAVLPGRFGVGVFSPPLDEHGNSVRGIEVCKDLSARYGLHLFQAANPPPSVRTVYSASAVSSKRKRPATERAALADHGGRIKVFELQGALDFAAAEQVLASLVDEVPGADSAIVDCRRVVSIDDGGRSLFVRLLNSAAETGLAILLSGMGQLPGVAAQLRADVDDGVQVRLFDDVDFALEAAEEPLLDAMLPGRTASNAVLLPDQELCAGLAADEMAVLSRLVTEETFAAGEVIIRQGDAADVMYFLKSGQCDITLDLQNGKTKRLSSIAAGTAFGEVALIEHSTRSATVRAYSDVTCGVLSVETFERLSADAPTLHATLLANLARNLTARLRKANGEIQALSG